MKTYIIKYWADEECRDAGESDIFSEGFSDIKKAIEQANNLFYRQDFACVEVEDEDDGETVYHISSDVPNGEHY